jgi:tetrahydromethanopterin S-methyltransferase subunit A
MTSKENPIGYDPGSWPPVRGDYQVGDPMCRIAVVTLASHLCVTGAAISGPCKTENLGVEKVVANVISNSNIRFLLVCGAESKGHLPGDAILALHRNGVDAKGRIFGSRGAIPFIENLPTEAIRRFQDQVKVINRIGLEDEAQIDLLVKEHCCMAEVYPEEPFLVTRPRRRHPPPEGGQGDVQLGSGVALETSAWVVLENWRG